MMQGAVLTLSAGKARVTPAPGLPLDRLLAGKKPEEVASLLPRLFNLCPMAQEQAARLALGLDGAPDPAPEVASAHRARLGVLLPLALGLAPRPLAPGALAGIARPADLLALPLARALHQAFARGEAVTRALPFPRGAEALTLTAFENSPAGRQARHPLLRAIEAEEGRSPLWRLAGIVADLQAAEAGTLPPALPGPVAVVQAARGAMALQIGATVLRRTPSDHLMVPGGILEQSMATCPIPLAPILLALHDPCVAVTLQEAQHA